LARSKNKSPHHSRRFASAFVTERTAADGRLCCLGFAQAIDPPRQRAGGQTRGAAPGLPKIRDRKCDGPCPSGGVIYFTPPLRPCFDCLVESGARPQLFGFCRTQFKHSCETADIRFLIVCVSTKAQPFFHRKPSLRVLSSREGDSRIDWSERSHRQPPAFATKRKLDVNEGKR
jgi:hypothetical protein